MRLHALSLAALPFVLAACADGADPCPLPADCLAAERVDATCTCTAWRTVRTEEVAVPYVVISVDYEPVGTATKLHFGETWDASQVPAARSSEGASLRFVVRRPDGTEQVARVGEVPARYQSLERVSDTVVRAFRGGGLWERWTDLDLPPIGRDSISAWVNPVVSLSTDAGGGKAIHLGVSPDHCVHPAYCVSPAPEPMSFGPGLLRGEVSWGPLHDGFVASLSGADRAALLAFDARQIGGASSFPRYQWLGSTVLSDPQLPFDATWTPCTDPDAFEVLAETPFPLQDGDTLFLQYGAQGSGECAPQKPGIVVGSATPDCTLRAEVLIDRIFGRLLLQPISASDACTR